MRKLFYFFFVLMLCIQEADAQNLTGRVTDADSAHTPLFQARVVQMQNGKAIATSETYFDGTYSIKVRPGQTYQLQISFPGRTDTTVSVSVDKYGKLNSGSLLISLHRHGLRLSGFVMDQAQDIPIPDVYIILRNVMTRGEERCTTGADGAYSLMMDYETNYTLKIDKMSPGILNKYVDTSFNISTIGFNKPLEFRLDINLGPSNGYTRPRPGYDNDAKPGNKDLKPALKVLGIRDSLLRHEQDSITALLIRKPHDKDPVTTLLTKRNNDINTFKVTPGSNADEQIKKDKEAARMAEEVKKRKKQLDEEQQKTNLSQTQPDLKAKQQAEKKELPAQPDVKTNTTEIQKKEEQLDNILKMAENPKREAVTHRKHVLDSMMNIASQRTRVKPDTHKADKTARQKDSIRMKKAVLDEKIKSIQADRQAAEQDSLLSAAEAKNKEILASRKHIRDSLALAEDQLLQSKRDKQKEREATELAEKQAREKDAEDKKRAEIALKEKQKREQAELKRAKGDQGRADGPKTGHYVAARKTQQEKDPAAMKKTGQGPEAKALNDKPQKDTVPKISKPDSKPIANQPAEQSKKEKPADEEVKPKVKEQIHIAVSKSEARSEERDDFDPTSSMSVIQFEKNSSKIPPDVAGDMERISGMMKEMPELRIKIYGLASLDEKHSMKLSVARAREVADLMVKSGIKPARIRTKGIGATSPRSGCTEGGQCTDARYKLDRVVMYSVVKEQ